MTREEAITWLENRAKQIPLPGALEVYRMAIAALRELDAQEKQESFGEWISVKDRLPDADGIYLVCDRRLNGVPWVHTAGFKKTSSSWCESHGMYYDDRYGRYREQDKFTHWMPLPEPPKEGRNNEM